MNIAQTVCQIVKEYIMIDSKNFNQSKECFERSKNLLQSLGEIQITKEFGVEPSSSNPALLLNISVWNQSMLLRIKELGNMSINLWQQNCLVSSAILTRCLLETVALYYHIETMLEDVIKNTCEINNMVKELWRAGLGRNRRNLKMLFNCDLEKTTDYEAIELELFRKALTIKCNSLKYSYSELSEYVHPNAPGTSGAYSSPNQKNLSFIFNGNFDHISKNVGYVLEFGLNIFQCCWSKMEILIPKFMEVYKQTLD